MNFLLLILKHSWELLLEASIYILFGVLVTGLLKVFINPSTISKHLGKGKILSVFKAAILGIPIPLCSCGVLPAAASLKKQGANNGAVTAFLISTPESGVDSIAITYALLDPIMTVARPIVALFSAVLAGILENIFGTSPGIVMEQPDLSCPVDSCCDGIECPPETHARHHSFYEKLVSGLKYAVTDIWFDLAAWFFAGLVVAGIMTAVIPEPLINKYLGGGLHSMLIALVVGIPLYICASASTPIAAALILKGVSPGTALVFLITGPATNVTSLSLVLKILGKRATVIYLSVVTLSAIASGIILDKIYVGFNISAKAMIGQSGEVFPYWFRLAGAVFLVLISIKPIRNSIGLRLRRKHKTCSNHLPNDKDASQHSISSIDDSPTCECSKLND